MWRNVFICLLAFLPTIATNQEITSVQFEPRNKLQVSYQFPKTLGASHFKLVHGLILVEATVDGKTGTFVIDTGTPGLVLNAQPTSIDTSFTASHLSGKVEIGSRKVGTLNWLGLQQRNVYAYEVDLSDFERRLNHPIAGLLGTDILDEVELFLDFERQLVLLFPLENSSLHRFSTPKERFSLQTSNGIYFLDLMHNGQLLRLALDTGCGDNLLDTKTWESLQLTDRTEEGELVRLRSVLGGEQLAPLSEPLLLSFPGGYESEQAFVLANMEHVADIGVHLDGVLGLPFFRSHRISLRLKEQLLLRW